MAINNATFILKEAAFSSLFNSKELNDYQAADQIMGIIFNLIDLHHEEMVNNLHFVDNFTDQYHKELSGSPIWSKVLNISEIYIKKLVEDSLTYTIASIIDKYELATPFLKDKTLTKEQKLVKYSKFIKKNVPILKALSLVTDVLSIHKHYEEALEKQRKHNELNEKVKFSEFLKSENSKLNLIKSNSKTKIRTEIFKNKNSMREKSFIIAASTLHSLKYKDQSGHNLYEAFNAKLIHAILKILKITTTLECDLYISDHLILKSVSFSGAKEGLGGLYIYLNSSNYTLNDILFLPSSLYGIEIPKIRIKAEFPAYYNISTESVIINLYPDYIEDQTKYTPKPEFYHRLFKSKWSTQYKQPDIYFPLMLSIAKFSMMKLSKGSSKFTNTKNLSMEELHPRFFNVETYLPIKDIKKTIR